jgi:hypothetical protein
MGARCVETVIIDPGDLAAYGACTISTSCNPAPKERSIANVCKPRFRQPAHPTVAHRTAFATG